MSAPVVWSILLKTTMRDRQSFHKIHEIVMFCAGGFSSSKWIQPGLDSGITRRSQRIVPIHFPLWTVLKPKWYDYYTFGSQREQCIFRSKVAGRRTIKVMIYISGSKSTKDAIIDTIRISGFCWYCFWPCTHGCVDKTDFSDHFPKRSLRKLRILRKAEKILNILNRWTAFLKA